MTFKHKMTLVHANMSLVMDITLSSNDSAAHLWNISRESERRYRGHTTQYRLRRRWPPKAAYEFHISCNSCLVTGSNIKYTVAITVPQCTNL